MSITSVRVFIRERPTGIVVEYQDKWYDGDDGNSLFNWAENNFSCDCNRHLMFTDWTEDAEDCPCNNDDTTARYRVRVLDANGTVLYDEWEASA